MFAGTENIRNGTIEYMELQMKKHLFRDACIIVGSVFLAIVLVRMGIVHTLVGFTGDAYILASFVAGAFFTSVFTTAPAIAVLGSLGSTYPLFVVALVGGFGALVGDAIIFRFFKKNISQDVGYILTLTHSQKIQKLLELRMFRWFLTSIGALIIASPLPDELGLALLGMSRIPLRLFVPISFTFNVLGIYVIGMIARAL